MVWILMVSVKDGYKFHSAHVNEQTALRWAECKEHDGAETSILKLTKDESCDLLAVLSKATGA